MTSRDLSPRAIVEAASRLLEAQRGFEAVEKYFSPDYVEHWPAIAGGNLAGFVQSLKDEGFTELTEPGQRQLGYHTDRVICEGEFVVVHQHITEPDKPVLVFMDIYRVRDGKIVEHWCVMQTAPENPANTSCTMW